MNNLRKNILSTLVYFDIFHYPLTNDEIRSFLTYEYPQSIIDETLESMTQNGIIFKLAEFYSLENDVSLIERRREGNRRATKQMKIAERAARILSRFPYVQGLAISGSLSKNFADKKTDIDFFVITTANRLWIARTFMHLFKKITFLAGRQHWFCMNYYVDENGLEIAEKNIFTAMEIVTLIPMQGVYSLQNFIDANRWTNYYFPSRNSPYYNTPKIKNGFFRKLVEIIFNTKMGDVMDTWLMNITDKRWQKKTQQNRLNERGIQMGMLVDRHYSKPNPKNFQDKVVKRHEYKMQQLLERKEETSAVGH